MNRFAWLNPLFLFVWIFRLIAIHSIGFGIALITFPCEWLEFFGFTINQKFFAVQGGVFHIIISFVYIRASNKPDDARDWVALACITKFTAAIFLFSYYLFATPVLMVLLSGFMDALMGFVMMGLYRNYLHYTNRKRSVP